MAVAGSVRPDGQVPNSATDNGLQKAFHKIENGADYIGTYVPIIGSGAGAVRAAVALISTVVGVIARAVLAIVKAPSGIKEKARRLQFWGARQVKIGLLELIPGLKWFAITKLGYDINSHEFGHPYAACLSQRAEDQYNNLFPQDKRQVVPQGLTEDQELDGLAQQRVYSKNSSGAGTRFESLVDGGLEANYGSELDALVAGEQTGGNDDEGRLALRRPRQNLGEAVLEASDVSVLFRGWEGEDPFAKIGAGAPRAENPLPLPTFS